LAGGNGEGKKGEPEAVKDYSKNQRGTRKVRLRTPGTVSKKEKKSQCSPRAATTETERRPRHKKRDGKQYSGEKTAEKRRG